MRPILRIDRVDLQALPNTHFYYEVKDFAEAFIEGAFFDPNDFFELTYDFNTNYDSWLQA